MAIDPFSIGMSIGGAVLGSLFQADASESAAETQSAAAQAGIAAQERMTQAGIAAQERMTQKAITEQRRQFKKIQELLAPYVQAGTGAIGGFQPFQQAGAQAFEQQRALAGLSGPAAQQAAISQIESSPFLKAQIQQGENALLQRASATGGLRGGNIQAALAQFRPQMLQQAVEQQYGRLGGLAGTGLGVTEALYRGGQASASGQASQAGALGQGIASALQQQGAGTASLLQQQGTTTASLLQQQGAAQAGGQLAGVAPFANLLNLPMQLAGANYARTGTFGLGNLFGGGGSGAGVISGGSGISL